MPYNNPKTPRFYVSILQYLNSCDVIYADTSEFPLLKLINIDCTNMKTLIPPSGNGDINLSLLYGSTIPFARVMKNKHFFHAILGHDFKTVGLKNYDVTTNGYDVYNSKTVNYELTGSDYYSNNAGGSNGYSICVDETENSMFSDATEYIVYRFTGHSTSLWANSGMNVGALLFGNYYDMPRDCDLNVKISYNMDGMVKQRTKSGKDLYEYQYHKPRWGNRAAWELGNVVPELGLNGRRQWDMSFSMINRDDVFPEDAINGALGSFGYMGSRFKAEAGYGEAQTATGEYMTQNSDAYHKTIHTHDNFISMVLMKVNNGLPFIFQPDNTDFSNLALCRFDQNNFSLTQQSPNHYTFKFRIKETW